MTAKEYLMQIRKLDIQIRNKKKELEVIQYQMTGVSSISYEKKEPTTSKSTLSPQEKYYPKYEKYSKSILADITKLIDLKKEAIKLIDSIDDGDCVNLLYKRYINCLHWKGISKEMNYSYSHLKRLHKKALNLLNEKMSHNEPF